MILWKADLDPGSFTVLDRPDSPLQEQPPIAPQQPRGKQLKKEFLNIAFDDNGNIGKRYRRQDEIGTPYCVTIDFDTLEDDTVTLRDRDTGEQTRVKISELVSKIK